MKKAIAFTISCILAIPVVVWAHEGHGHTHGYSIIHYFVEPEHAWVTIPVFILLLLYFGHRNRKSQSENQ